ncbi:hypothetical protein MCOR27_005503 [Pyricularia oryzae]|uniref:Uncharacterized protein n=7 Tax=Pyricularia TaxID=48558 RepID=A0A6P8AZF8_PYRGI|nr:uncharacterized protein MGG_10930 [Pyricularia oryzae 70-15]XP_030980305.1 hypothetical protein PgNI_10996 [Pyricularia grisea]KAH8837955.1 hypothetical protein MCOR01_009401 [Pyricularia oryzae]TLD18561.1 hypothetical protein PspLS_10217 [Pyricularia sp. CBS 133598]KAH9437335.1 hypothetical protein MCOR02_000991 [Pyricularia oryzae]KAI6252244.1 hypothetical protein MCOR19_011143 [Pyricularia oryzae]KAI6268816.1 hypothetical protein MCOR26_009008 [Pyricularia oryzae]
MLSNKEMNDKINARMMEKTLTRDKIKTEKEIAALKKRILELLKKGRISEAEMETDTLASMESILEVQHMNVLEAKRATAQLATAAATRKRLEMNARMSKINSGANSNAFKMLEAIEADKAQKEQAAMSQRIYMEAMTEGSGTQVPHARRQELWAQMLDEAGVDVGERLSEAQVSTREPERESAPEEPTPEVESDLNERLRSLRAM